MGAQGLKVFRDFGGLSTRPTPVFVDAQSTGKMRSPAMRNCDTFAVGGMAKRLGYTKQGDDITGTGPAFSQLANDSTGLSPFTTGVSTKPAIAQKFTTTGAVSALYVNAYTSVSSASLPGGLNTWAAIYTDSGGSPGTLVATTGSVAVPKSTTPEFNSYLFPAAVALSSTTSYWLVLYTERQTLAAGGALYYGKTGSGSSGRVKRCVDIDSPTWITSTSNDIYFALYATSAASSVNGLYDYRYGAGQTQKVVAAVGGNPYYKDGTSWTGFPGLTLGSGPNVLWDMKTIKDLLVITDYGTSAPRAWNGTAEYHMKLGYRPTFTTGSTSSSGGPWSGSGASKPVKVMGVVALTSGGYRTTAVASVTLGGTDYKINLASIENSVGAYDDLGFDAGTTNTTWYASVPGGVTLYKVPDAYISGAGNVNPPTNNTDFSILPMTDAQLQAGGTLLTNYGLEQGYFTSQIAAPTGKCMAVWNSMLVIAGVGDSKLYFSEESAPGVWSTYGGLQGSVETINTNDGDDIIGLYVDGGYLYAQKRNSTFIVQFSGNANTPFIVRQISAKVGTLSHWSNKTIPGRGFATLTSAGPKLVSGTEIVDLPGALDIIDRFEPNSTTRYNLSVMTYTTAGINTARKLIRWTAASTNATRRDTALVYDYERGIFWEEDNLMNFYAEVSDSNFYVSLWAGDYASAIYALDSGTTDNGAAIAWSYATPHFQCGGVTQTSRFTRLHLSGAAQASGSIMVSVYVNQSSTPAQTFAVPMTGAFNSGFAVPLGLVGKSIQFVLSNAEDTPVRVDSLGLSFEVLRESYGEA